MSRPGEYVATGKYVATGSMSRQAVCRDKQYVATDVATSSMSRPMSRQAAVCRDKQYVATNVATSSMSRPMSRQAVCRDQCRDKQALSRQESFVATRMLQKPKKN